MISILSGGLQSINVYLKSLIGRNYQIHEQSAQASFYGILDLTIDIVITETKAESMF